MRFLRIKRNKDSNYYRSVLKSFFKRKKIKYTKKLLLWEMGGFDLILRQNAIIGSAMKLRGYKPIIVICDGTPQACIQREINNEEKMEDWCKRCKSCSLPMKNEAKKYDMEYIYTSQFIDKDKKKEFHDFSLKIPLKEITDFEYKVVNIGKITFSSFSRYMKGFVVDVSDITKEHEPIYRKYFYATLVNFYICDVILTKIKPDSILTSHGVYIDYTPPVYLAFLKNIPCLSWTSGFKNFNRYFTALKSSGGVHLRGITEEAWNTIKNGKYFDHINYYITRNSFKTTNVR